MNFKEWREKYYPDLKDKDIGLKMSHAWASGHVDMGASLVNLVDELRALIERWDKYCPDCGCEDSEIMGKMKSKLDELDFSIEERSGIHVIFDKNGYGCRPATDTELAMWNLICSLCESKPAPAPATPPKISTR